jgi:hypothetical protein
LASQGQAIASASADGSVLPVEIAFLQRHGVDASLLRRAADAARRSGSFADEALLKLDLLDEPFFYRALAAEIGVPFLDGEIPVAAQARFPTAFSSASRRCPACGPATLASCSRRQASAWLGSFAESARSPRASPSQRPLR